MIVNVLGNDTFGAGANVTSVGAASNGSVVINADNTVTYTPNVDYHGSDSFTYTVTTAAGNTETATVTVAVTPVVDAVADTPSTAEDTAVIVNVLGNDTFGAGANVTSVGAASNGSVVINPDNTVTYTPNVDYHGSDSFTYTVTTAAGNTETATVTVAVTPVVDAVADTPSTAEDTAVIGERAGQRHLRCRRERHVGGAASNGSVVVNADNTVTYTPNVDYHGSDSFTYTVTTAAGNTETATVTVAVTPVVDAVADTPSTAEDTGCDRERAGQRHVRCRRERHVGGAASNGSVVINADNTVTYTPNVDYHGSDSFTYTVTTAAGNTETATVTVAVTPVVDAVADTPSTAEDTAVTVNVSGQRHLRCRRERHVGGRGVERVGGDQR